MSSSSSNTSSWTQRISSGRESSGPYLCMAGKSSSTNIEDESKQDTNKSLSSVGLDWLFSDSEPDQPQVTRMLRSRSESPKSSTAAVPASEPSRDSSHGSSGTDTETRALLDKLECVENILEQSSGAIPKRKPPSRRVRSAGRRSGSLDAGHGGRGGEMEADT